MKHLSYLLVITLFSSISIFLCFGKDLKERNKPLSYYDPITKRNIFSSISNFSTSSISNLSLSTEAKNEVKINNSSPPTLQKEKKPQLKLTGIVKIQDKYRIIIEGEEKGGYLEGENSFKDIKILKIEKNKVLINISGQQIELEFCLQKENKDEEEEKEDEEDEEDDDNEE